MEGRAVPNLRSSGGVCFEVKEPGDRRGAGRHSACEDAGADGVPLHDPDGRNAITEARQYVFTEWNPMAAGDLKASRSVWDTNGDGRLTAADTEFAKLKVMVTNAAPPGSLQHSLSTVALIRTKRPATINRTRPRCRLTSRQFSGHPQSAGLPSKSCPNQPIARRRVEGLRHPCSCNLHLRAQAQGQVRRLSAIT